ncbi:Uncharacterised protein [Mycolicibacterium phlei]|nr:Uncharacterised protein [Mycolicibacterium phlei]
MVGGTASRCGFALTSSGRRKWITPIRSAGVGVATCGESEAGHSCTLIHFLTIYSPLATIMTRGNTAPAREAADQ